MIDDFKIAYGCVCGERESCPILYTHSEGSRVRGTGPFLVIIHFICICLLSSSFFVDCYCPVVDPVFRFSDGDTVQRLVTMRMAEVRY